MKTLEMTRDQKEIYKSECTKWDEVVLKKVTKQGFLEPDANFSQFAQRTSTMSGVSEFLGNLHGKQVLEYGCGLGRISILLAKSGGRVSSFDLSSRSASLARERAVFNNVNSNFQVIVAAGETLPYANESFDVIVGNAILHHLNVNLGWSDLYRVLKKNGKAVFVEPMGMNPVLNFIRDYVPYSRKNPRGADQPLTYGEIQAWGKNFSKFHFREIQLLSMLERLLGFEKRKQLNMLRSLDDVLLRHLPYLKRYCRYVIMFMVK